MHRLLDVHVVEVVGDEQRERAVQAFERRGARAVGGVADAGGEVAQVGDRPGVVHVLGGDARRGAGARALERRVHEGVLVGQVHLAQREQPLELAERGGDVGGVARVGAAHARQRVGHEQAQRLVDAGVEVAPARRRGSGGRVVRAVACVASIGFLGVVVGPSPSRSAA